MKRHRIPQGKGTQRSTCSSTNPTMPSVGTAATSCRMRCAGTSTTSSAGTSATGAAGTRSPSATSSAQVAEAVRAGRCAGASSGPVYPTLQQLSDEGLVTSEEVDGRRTFTLTEEGRKAAAEAGTRSPWADAQADADRQPDVRELGAQ